MEKRGAGRPVAPLRDGLYQLSNPQAPTAVTKLASCATRVSPRGPSLALRAIHLVSRLRRAADMCSSTESGTAQR